MLTLRKLYIYIHNGKYIFKFNTKKGPTLYMPLPARIQMHLFVTLHIFTLLTDLWNMFSNQVRLATKISESMFQKRSSMLLIRIVDFWKFYKNSPYVEHRKIILKIYKKLPEKHSQRSYYPLQLCEKFYSVANIHLYIFETFSKQLFFKKSLLQKQGCVWSLGFCLEKSL